MQIAKKKKIEKWGRGVNCEEEMREKNEMGEGGCMCVVGEKKKERPRVHWWWEKKKKKEIKRKKVIGSAVYMYGRKKGGVEKKEEKNLKGKQLNWFYLYVHFVWCKV